MMISDRAEERRRTATELDGTAVQVEWLIFLGESYRCVLVLGGTSTTRPQGEESQRIRRFFPFQYCILSRAFPFGPGSLPLFRFSAFGEGGAGLKNPLKKFLILQSYVAWGG